MKKLLVLLPFIIHSAVFAGADYEPELLKSEINAPVMLYLPTLDVGFTAVKVNSLQDYRIKSTDGKQFTLIAFNSVSLIEAITAENKVLTHTGTRYTIEAADLAKMNEHLGDGEILFSEFLEKIEPFMQSAMFGNQQAPDTKAFAKLRRVNVFTMTVMDSSGKKAVLQVFFEQFRDAAEL